jgi:hypothetical protein
VRHADENARQLPQDKFAQPLLVCRVLRGPQGADGDGFDAAVLELLNLGARLRFVQFPDDLAVGIDALVDLDHEISRNQRRNAVAQVGIGTLQLIHARGLAPQAPDRERVAEASGGEHGGLCRAAGEERVEADGRAVPEALDPAAELLEAQPMGVRGQHHGIEHAAEQVVGGGRLEDARIAGIGRDPQVGERAADIGSDQETHRSLLSE